MRWPPLVSSCPVMPRSDYHADLPRPCPSLGRRGFFAGAAALAASWLLPSPARASGRWWRSLVWGVFENRAFSEVAGLPSHRRLAQEGAVLSRYFAVAHPSGPNYRAMVSGDTWGSAEVVDTFHPTVSSEAASLAIPTYVYHLAGRIALRHNPFADLHAPVEATRYGLSSLEEDLRGRLPESCLVYVGGTAPMTSTKATRRGPTGTSRRSWTSSRGRAGSARPTSGGGFRPFSSATTRTTGARGTASSPRGGAPGCAGATCRPAATPTTGSAAPSRRTGASPRSDARAGKRPSTRSGDERAGGSRPRARDGAGGVLVTPV